MTAGSAPSTQRGRGRPPCCSRDLALRIIRLRARGLSYAKICDVLNADQVQTPMGGSHWLKSHVDRLLHTKYVQELGEELEQHQLHKKRGLSAVTGTKLVAPPHARSATGSPGSAATRAATCPQHTTSSPTATGGPVGLGTQGM